jgi:uncharacterized membrane protein YoaK (UPF0700 family)
MSHIIDGIRTDLSRTRLARTLIRRTVGLGFVAGFVNTVGFFDLHVYPGIMTGNTVQLGIALAQNDWHLVSLSALTIASFFVGGIAGSLIRRHLRRPPLELIVMAVLLLAATPVRTRANNAIPVELGLLAIAMAMQGEIISRIGTVSVQTVVVTNNLLHFADALVGRFLSTPAATEGQGTHPRATVTEVAIPGWAWASYSIGACAGALAIVSVRAPLLFPIFVVVLLVVDMLMHAESRLVVQMEGASPKASRSGGQSARLHVDQ